MKKHILFAVRYTFYITVLLFFKDSIKSTFAILWIAILFLENKYYSIIPLILCFFVSPLYSILILAGFLYHVLFYKFIQKNRYYALSILFVCYLTLNMVPILNHSYNFEVLYSSLLCFILYGIVQCFYVYYKKSGRFYTMILHERLFHLTILFSYLCLFTYMNSSSLLFYFLFMQLFLLQKPGYSILFFFLQLFLSGVSKQTLDLNSLSYLATSFFPPAIGITLDYSLVISYFYLLYSILLFSINLFFKNVLIEHDYISNLFKDFKTYLCNLSIEYDTLNTLKTLKENHLEAIQTSFCTKCNEDSICRYKQDKRYSFLCNAMNHENNNIYECPHYSKFFFDTKLETRTSFLQFNAMSTLADELEYLYAQNVKSARYYTRFIKEIQFYNYQIHKLDIHLDSKTLYFSICLSKTKPILKEIFLKVAHKSFHEAIELKVVEEDTQYIVYIYKKPKVKIEYAHKVLAKDSNILSGDNIYIKKDYNETFMFALSDGMGSGHEAYRESSEALKKISQLSTYHFSLKTMLKLLESFYDLKCEYDSYATLDLLHINPSNMKLNLYKLGSTTTYIYHNYALRALENKALPLKLDDINSSYELEYFKNDVILLCSDGVSDFISEEELNEKIDFTKPSEWIVNSIFELLKQKEKRLKDDASIIVIRIV